jgi:integrase
MVDGKPMTMIVVRDDNGRRYTEKTANTAFHKVREAAGLPEGMTPTGFRHGGATELGDAVVAAGVEDPDLRPITGHATREMVDIYNKVTVAKARALSMACVSSPTGRS